MRETSEGILADWWALTPGCKVYLCVDGPACNGHDPFGRQYLNLTSSGIQEPGLRMPLCASVEEAMRGFEQVLQDHIRGATVCFVRRPPRLFSREGRFLVRCRISSHALDVK
jgi:hypothetical protein